MPAREAPVRRRFPGPAGAFTLFGEVLWTGILVALCSLPVVTIPAALAAGIRHLRRYLNAQDSRVGLFFRDVWSALIPGGVLVGVGAALACGMLALQFAVVPGMGLPGAEALLVITGVLLVVVLVLLCLAAASWGPTRGWRPALGLAVTRAVADPVGALLTAVAVALTLLAGWQLPPLVVPALGCLAFALTVVTARSRR